MTDGTAIFGFFEHALAALGPATSMVGGHLALEVHGEGRRVVDLSVPGGRWSSHDDEPAASTVWGTADALTDLVLHPDRIPLHVRAGALKLSGGGILLFGGVDSDTEFSTGELFQGGVWTGGMAGIASRCSHAIIRR